MLKPLLVILTIVTFMAIWLNFDIFHSTPNTITPPTLNRPTTSEPLNKTQPTTVTVQHKPIITNRDKNLSQEIQALFKQANLLFEKSLDDEALEMYDKIIKKIGNSTDIARLKDFAKAYFQKALIYQIYPNNDKDSAFEAYNKVIKKFEKSDNHLLLKLYIQANIRQAYLLNDDERIEVYDELVKKFENYKNNAFQTEIDNLLLNESYELMGKDNEQSMTILDTIISKYDKSDNGVLPKTIQTSILNAIELSIITNNDDTKYKELANNYLSKSPDTKPLLKMLDIIKNAEDLNQDEALSEWKKEYTDYHFPNWSFQELRAWMMKIEDKETRERVGKYINAFQKHKYNVKSKNIIYQDSSTSSSKNYESTNEAIEYRNPYTYKNDQEYPLEVY